MIIRILIIASGLSFVADASLAQSLSAERVSDQNLDFFLIQAFNSKDARSRLALNHIGIQGQKQEAGFLVTSVLESYPAHRAGLNRGDIITSIDGQPFDPVTGFNRAAAFAPELNSRVLSVLRNTDLFEVTVTPVFENLYDSFRSANSASLQQFSAGNKIIGYLHLWGLSRSSHDLILTKLLMQELAQCDGIILDLRDSYGFLDPEHLLVLLTNYSKIDIADASGWLTSINNNASPIASNPYRRPLAILINERTRGGPEILAYETSKLERIVSLGSATPGRIGSYEQAGDSGAFKYQPADSTRIDGQRFEDIGLRPESVLEWPLSEIRRDDPQFEAAVTLLLGII